MTITPLLALLLIWAQTPDGTNTLAALICAVALLGASSRVCLLLTLLLHLALIVL